MLPALEHGRLPVLIGDPANPRERSPYPCTCSALVQHFAVDVVRARLIQSYFAFRAALQNQLSEESWQWVGGSVLETQRRPNDLDVVVWLSVGDANRIGAAMAAGRFPTRAHLHAVEKLHVFYVAVDVPPRMFQQTSYYWYELWTTMRAGGRKGFVELDSGEDGSGALALLRNLWP